MSNPREAQFQSSLGSLLGPEPARNAGQRAAREQLEIAIETWATALRHPYIANMATETAARRAQRRDFLNGLARAVEGAARAVTAARNADAISADELASLTPLVADMGRLVQRYRSTTPQAHRRRLGPINVHADLVELRSRHHR